MATRYDPVCGGRSYRQQVFPMIYNMTWKEIRTQYSLCVYMVQTRHTAIVDDYC